MGCCSTKQKSNKDKTTEPSKKKEDGKKGSGNSKTPVGGKPSSNNE
jgi:hypothetical protein